MLRTNFREGVEYLFRSENLVNMVLLPGGVLFVYQLLMAGLGFVMALVMPGIERGGGEMGGMIMIVLAVLLLIFGVGMVGMAWFYGYLWRLLGQWKTEGFQAPALSWLADIPGLLLDGLKLLVYFLGVGLLYCLVLGLLMIPFGGVIGGLITGLVAGGSDMEGLMGSGILITFLMAFGLMFLFNIVVTPFLMAPVFYAAERTLGSVFNLMPAFGRARSAFWQVLLVMLAFMVAQWVLMIVAAIVHLVTCGVGSLFFSFLTVPGVLVYFYWLAEVYFKDGALSEA